MHVRYPLFSSSSRRRRCALPAFVRACVLLALVLCVLAIAPATAAAADFKPGVLLFPQFPSSLETNVGTAAFGPALSYPGVSGAVVVVDDGVGSTLPIHSHVPGTTRTDDGCEPLVNSAQVSGNIALLTRGACTFVAKVKNAQDAGAIAVIVVDIGNSDGPVGGMALSPTPQADIVIPSIMVRWIINWGNPVRIGLFDTSMPVIVHTVTGTLGSNGWYTSDVGLTWSVTEPETPTTLQVSGCVDQTITVDQPAHDYSCEAWSEGGGFVDSYTFVTIKRDATAPTLAFTGNAGTYTITQTIAVGCAASDNLSGVASGCAGVSAPAYTFAVGANTITRTATDNAGNTGTGTASFTVIVTSASLCELTKLFVQSSGKYQALSSALKAKVDALAEAVCAKVAAIEPALTPAQKAKLISAYKLSVDSLAVTGWLTTQQATTLKGLADTL